MQSRCRGGRSQLSLFLTCFHSVTDWTFLVLQRHCTPHSLLLMFFSLFFSETCPLCSSTSAAAPTLVAHALPEYQDLFSQHGRGHKTQVDSLAPLCASGIGKHCSGCRSWSEIQRSAAPSEQLSAAQLFTQPNPLNHYLVLFHSLTLPQTKL